MKGINWQWERGEQTAEKITSPEPINIESEYALKIKEYIKQNKERFKSLELDITIGELAKKMNTGEKKIEKG
jgi:hypothetical protein